MSTIKEKYMQRNMLWQIIPIRLTYYRPRWRLFIQSITLLLTFFIIIYKMSDIIIKCPAYKSVRLFHRNRVALDFDYQKYINMTWKSKYNDIPLLTIFTTWNPAMQKQIVYANAVKNWLSLSQDIRTIAYTNDSKVADIAKRGNWTVMPLKNTACFGTPVLRGMFTEAMKLPIKSKFYAYSNADIVFNSGLVKSLTEIIKSHYFDEGPILIVGKRIDVNISKLDEPEVNSSEDVGKLAKHGKISWGFAADFFITNDLFPWEFVPDLVIGRALVDNWLLWFAREIGAKVIDVTGTVLAVHQLANGLRRIQFLCNKAEMWKSTLLPNMPIWKGLIECASYETKYNSRGEVIILPKKYLIELCKHDEAVFH